MSKYTVILENDVVVLKSTTEPWVMSTLPDHKDIWVKYYLNKIVTNDNFTTKEVDINEEMVEVIALPVIKSDII